MVSVIEEKCRVASSSIRRVVDVSTEFTENEDTQEKSQEFREKSRFIGIVVGSEKEKKKNDKKIIKGRIGRYIVDSTRTD